MKILIIGQAPGKKEQKVPYDTTMLYEMLSWVNIDKNLAQKLFEFEAIYNEFPGSEGSKHFKPTKEQMDKHWMNTLETKVQIANTVILLGKVAQEYFYSKPKTYSCNLLVLEMIHPSYRNRMRIIESKEKIKSTLEEAMNHEYNDLFDPKTLYKYFEND